MNNSTKARLSILIALLVYASTASTQTTSKGLGGHDCGPKIPAQLDNLRLYLDYLDFKACVKDFKISFPAPDLVIKSVKPTIIDSGIHFRIKITNIGIGDAVLGFPYENDFPFTEPPVTGMRVSAHGTNDLFDPSSYHNISVGRRHPNIGINEEIIISPGDEFDSSFVWDQNDDMNYYLITLKAQPSADTDTTNNDYVVHNY